jgi:hypothetical protein
MGSAADQYCTLLLILCVSPPVRHMADSQGQSPMAVGVVLLIGAVIYMALMLLQDWATRDDPHRCDDAMAYMDAGCRNQSTARLSTEY